MQDDPRVLVSTDWLAARLEDPLLRVIDASWHMPATGRDARVEYEAAHIPGASFFDIDQIVDPRSSLPHMAAPPRIFASRVRALGIGDAHQVVIYDDSPVRSAARVWWNFRLMGLANVAVLDGGFGKWQAEDRPVDALPATVRDRHLTVQPQPGLVSDVTHVAKAAKLGLAQIVDARSPERFRGEAPEPRPGLRAGHIPGSLNLPFGQLLKPDGTMKPTEALRAEFVRAGVDLDRPVITTCGSGVTAAILFLALERIGHQNHSLYDGSWSEWGSFPDLNIATGDA